GSLQIGAYRREIRLPLHRAVSAHALVNFRQALIEHLGLDDVEGKYFRARLVTDLERVTEAPGDQQERSFALALEQGVGCDCRAHLHSADTAGRDLFASPQSEQIANALHS